MESETLGEDAQEMVGVTEHDKIGENVNSNAFISPGRHRNDIDGYPYQNVSGEALIDSHDYRGTSTVNDVTRVIAFE